MTKLPEGATQIAPYLLYEDPSQALEWLRDAFGFEERMRLTEGDGTVFHAEMTLGDGMFMLGTPGHGYQNPAHSGHRHHQVYVYVDDVDAHFEQARAHGAEIVAEPEDQFYGDRRYAARDLEGHEWYFATHVREVSPEEMAQGPGGQ